MVASNQRTFVLLGGKTIKHSCWEAPLRPSGRNSHLKAGTMFTLFHFASPVHSSMLGIEWICDRRLLIKWIFCKWKTVKTLCWPILICPFSSVLQQRKCFLSTLYCNVSLSFCPHSHSCSSVSVLPTAVFPSAENSAELMLDAQKILVGWMILMLVVDSKNNYSARHHIYITQRTSCGRRYQKNGGIHGTAARGMIGHRLSSFGT